MFTPTAQRESKHPFGVVLVISLWLALACNLPMWRVLWQDAGLGTGQVLWVALLLVAMMVFGLSAVLSPLNWPLTLRPLLCLLLLISAANTYLLFSRGLVLGPQLLQLSTQELTALLNWRMLVPVLLLGVLPSMWVWRTPLRRIRPMRRLVQNISFGLTTLLLFAALWMTGRDTLQPLLDREPGLAQLLSPVNTLLSLAQTYAGLSLDFLR